MLHYNLLKVEQVVGHHIHDEEPIKTKNICKKKKNITFFVNQLHRCHVVLNHEKISILCSQ